MSQRRRSGFTRRSFLAGTGAVAAGLSFRPSNSWGAEEAKLNFYNWDTYIGETTLDDFKAASGIEVTMDLFAADDELYAKLKEGNSSYDVIVPSNDYVERMVGAKMLLPLDHSKIPNFKNVSKPFRDGVFDPGRKHSMPYVWGTIGIGYRKSKVKGTPDSWKVLLDSDRYSGRIALLGEAASVIGSALKYLEYSYNSRNPDEIQKAEALLTKQKPHIKVFADDNGQDLLLSGEVDLAMEWNGDILQIMAEDDDISYIVPKEGGILWQSCLAIPNGAPHPDNAHKFINYILDAKVGAAIADFIQYATPNEAAKKLMPSEYVNNPAVFPPDDVIAKSELPLYLGEETIRRLDAAWTRIRAA